MNKDYLDYVNNVQTICCENCGHNCGVTNDEDCPILRDIKIEMDRFCIWLQTEHYKLVK